MKKKNLGFTLIEIMLVIVLLALASVAVVMNLPDTKQDLAKEQAQRFYYRLQLLNESAILNGKDFGLTVDSDKKSYRYLVLEADGWQVLEDKIYTETALEEGLSIDVELGSNAWSNNESLFSQESLFDEDMFSEYEEEDKIEPPELLVLSSGEVTPFSVSIYPEGNRENGWLVDVQESGVIRLLRVIDFENEER